MKVKCILEEGINGFGYENFKFNEVRNLKKDLANLLISFGYAKSVDKNDDQENNDQEDNNKEGGEEK